MKSIYFKSTHLLSISSKKAFYFEFSPDINIITGENDTGKSSLIKSLYYTLGADIRIDKRWKNENFIAKVVIHISGHDYAFIRHNKRISIFNLDDCQKHLVTSSSRTDIARVVKGIFDFNLELVVKTTSTQTQALPAALYLPFYIDQDNGWAKVLNSFDGLGMYIDWQNNILHYHTGIKPKEYYKLKGKVSLIDIELSEISATLKALISAQKKFEESFGRVLFDIDINYYESLLERFLKKCQKLYTKETNYRVDLIKVLSERDEIVLQIEESTRQMNDNDIDSLSEKIDLNSKYEVLKNREKLLQIIPELYELKDNYSKKITDIKTKLTDTKKLSSELETMLREVRAELTLQDVIKAQASKQVEATFDEQIDILSGNVGNLNIEKERLESKLLEFSDKKRTKDINSIFKEHLVFACAELGIQNPIIEAIVRYSSITKSETGSRAPRAILAYHYALLKTIEEKSTIPMLPVVIDSPKQQDVDPKTSKKIFKLCIDGLSKKNQLIIGSVSIDSDIKNFKSIVLKDEYSLLKKELYDEVYQQIMPLYESVPYPT